MTVTDAERQAIIHDYELEKLAELRLRMSKLGRSRSQKKRNAARKSLKIANAVRLGRPRPKVKK